MKMVAKNHPKFVDMQIGRPLDIKAHLGAPKHTYVDAFSSLSLSIPSHPISHPHLPGRYEEKGERKEKDREREREKRPLSCVDHGAACLTLMALTTTSAPLCTALSISQERDGGWRGG